MHIPTSSPACFTEGPATPRVSWAYDQARGCGNAADPDAWKANLHHTPGCDGCSRAEHALAVFFQRVEPLPSIKTGATNAA
jgi:hypothetical protein